MWCALGHMPVGRVIDTLLVKHLAIVVGLKPNIFFGGLSSRVL